MKDRNLYALILGVSSGFGRATAIELAKLGYNIIGVHLDMGSNKKKAEEFRASLEMLGARAIFYNANAADETNRKELIQKIKANLNDHEGSELRVLLHSLAFGAIKPFFAENIDDRINKRGVEMTMDVMANSLLYWTQDLFYERLLAENSRIFALSSIGSERAMQNYGAISAAKAALEAYVRQIAVELAPYKITTNAIMAGLTDTPAAQKIPGFTNMLDSSKQHNPFGRNTLPEDVAKAISMLADEKFYWITGATIKVDGGEGILNFIEQ
ncbi:MAG: SDR family oxidoreductase [Candidatus Kapabacteria bacterium]|nr:SDR family oxidoreductase [Candidatus Kapabacteria bacterium]